MKKGWEVKKLGEVCELIARGISPKYIEGDGLIVLNQKCIRDHKISLEQSRFHDDSVKKVNSERYIRRGDVLINSTGTGTLGRVAQVREDVNNIIVDSHVSIVRPLPNLFVDDFFGWALIKIEDQIAKSGEGCGGQTELSRNALKNNFEISYPKSLTEQRRIVSILDEAFAAIDQAKENVQRNLQNAKELFQSELNSIFANKGEGWEEKAIQGVSKVISGFSFKSTDFSSSNQVKSVKITNVGVKEFVEEEGNYLPTHYNELYSNFTVNIGNIVIALTRTIISSGLKVAVVPGSYQGALLNQRVAALIPFENLINQRFLYNFLCTEQVANYVRAHVNTLMQPNLSINDLKKLPVPCPDLETQCAIVQKLDKVSMETERLENLYQQKLYMLEELKKSILQKVFSGELSEVGFSGLKDGQDVKSEIQETVFS
jgi:type I restriction enzyme S subunit